MIFCSGIAFRAGAVWLLLCFSLSAYAVDKVWTGVTSNNWNTGSNWQPAGVPIASDNVDIPGSGIPNMPQILSGISARAAYVGIHAGATLTIQGSAELEIDGTEFASLNIDGTLINSGTLRIKRGDFHCIDNRGSITNNNIMLLGTSTASPFTCKEEGIRNYNGGQFTNSSTGQLTIQRTGNNGILLFSGSPSFTNHGQITIRDAGLNPSTAATADGVDVRAGTFTNESTGNILIRRVTANGFQCRLSGATTNKGSITIRNVGTIDAEELTEGITNTTNFTNTATGGIYIDSVGNNAIVNEGNFTNGGYISIGWLYGAIAGNGVSNGGNFTNQTGANLIIRHVTGYGIVHGSVGGNIFTNSTGATIAIGRTGKDGVLCTGLVAFDNQGLLEIGFITGSGIKNSSQFVNQPPGTINIEETTGSAILNEEQFDIIPVTFKNAGKITIGTADNNDSAITGIHNATKGSFENLFCGEIISYQKIVNGSTATFKNEAFIHMHATAANSNSGTFTNDGVIESTSESFAGVSLTNNDFIVEATSGSCVISNVLRKGAGTNVTIGSTWYKLANLTLPAGTYNQAANTFSISGLFPGVYTLYFSATDNATGCVKTLPIRVTVNVDNTPPTAICRTVTVALDQNGAATITAAQVDNGSNDICGIASLSLSKTTFDCSNLGDNAVTLTVTDNNGNSSTCTATVKVFDFTKPTIAGCVGSHTLVLDATCSVVVPDYRPLITASDNCSVAAITQTPAPGTILYGTGLTTGNIRVTDEHGNNEYCPFLLSIVDNTRPTFTCPANQTVVLDAFCSAVLPDYRNLITDAADNCSVLGIIQSPAPGTPVSGRGNMIVLMIVNDVNGNTSDCSFVVNKVDNTPPTISCPTTTPILPLGQFCYAVMPDYRSLATSAENCGAPVITQSPSPGTLVDNAGNMTVTLTATDLSGNSVNCSFTVTKVDNTPPTAICFPQTLTFNGEAQFALNKEALVNASDNCGVADISLSPSVITCSQIGQVVPFTATITDINGNVATCTNNITVTGLPCGWSQNPDGVNCNDGNSSSYHPPTQVFTATSTNCYYAPPFTSDAMAFAQYRLCGNGSITAQVTGISNFGWAGVILRESNDAGAKKVQLTTNMNSNQSRREVRYTTGGDAYPQQFAAQGRFWLRLVRQGTQVIGYTSPNGVQWYQAMAVTVSMNSCIEAGLVLSNFLQNSTVTATFANVSITGGSTPTLGSAAQGFVPASDAALQLSVYPNPNNGHMTLSVQHATDESLHLTVMDAFGRIVRNIDLTEGMDVNYPLDLSGEPAGIYYLRLRPKAGPEQMQRIVLQN